MNRGINFMNITRLSLGTLGGLAAIIALAIFLTVPVRASGKNRGGGELWEANCRHCHNLRPPQQFNSNQWEILVNHMRVRCGLTGEEVKKITEFLKNAH